MDFSISCVPCRAPFQARFAELGASELRWCKGPPRPVKRATPPAFSSLLYLYQGPTHHCQYMLTCGLLLMTSLHSTIGPSLRTDAVGCFRRGLLPGNILEVDRTVMVDGVRWLKIAASAYGVLESNRQIPGFQPFDVATEGWTTTMGSDGSCRSFLSFFRLFVCSFFLFLSRLFPTSRAVFNPPHPPHPPQFALFLLLHSLTMRLYSLFVIFFPFWVPKQQGPRCGSQTGGLLHLKGTCLPPR